MRPFVKFLVVVATAAAVAAPAAASISPGAAAGNAVAGSGLAVPPARVGRISAASGGLSFRAAGETAWSPAGVNYPVAVGEGFQTGPGGRAEIEIGAAHLSLAGDTEIKVTALDARNIAIKLDRGTAALRLARLAEGESFAVELPHGRATLAAPGRYEITADTLPAAVKPAAKDPDAPAAKAALPADVAAGITGVEELAAAGSWTNAPGLGAVWRPKDVPEGWAPYRDGRWVWIEPWGWTWIDDQPWGFAPSHFGRWAEIDGKWAWLPGKKGAVPVYAPALVAFIGTAGVGISVAGAHGPAIGWFPLAPGEIYWPSYTGDLGYIRALNRPDVANAETIRPDAQGRPPVEIVNWHFQNRLAASVVPRPVFAAGRPVAPALLRLPEERLREAPAIMGSPRVTPAMLRALAAPPPKQPAVAHKEERAPAVRVAVAPQKALAHSSVAERLHRAAEKTEPARPAARLHAAGAHFRVPAYARAEPRHAIVKARAVRPAAKPAHAPRAAPRAQQIAAKRKAGP